jgi:quercetin dioxygenase-like cupin family protein
VSATNSLLPTGNAAEPLWFIHNLAYVHIDGSETDDAFDLGEVWGARGDMPPLHVHHREDEVFYVLEGQLTLFYGEKEITTVAGQVVVAPRGVAHAYRVDSDLARWLVLGVPAGFEQFVRALSEPAPASEMPPADRPVDAARIASVAAQYGIEILAPPGTLPQVEA